MRAIYERGKFSAQGFQADWLADGSGYTRLERVPGADGPEFVHYDAAGGERTVLVSIDELRPPGVFHVGIAVVPKPQAHLYNAWFQEIYMRTEDAHGPLPAPEFAAGTEVMRERF